MTTRRADGAPESPEWDESMRLHVYRTLAATGRAPDVQDVARELACDPDAVRRGLRRLAADRHVVLDADGRIVMAHPFATIPLGFSVMGASTLWWGGCAWDSFAIPHLVAEEPSVLVATRCPACDTAHAWNVTREQPPSGTQVAHFLVPTAHMWDDVVHTCSNQRIFCDPTCVEQWLASEGRTLGAILDLGTLWRLARGWYSGRLDPGYTRREPAAAVAYFRSAGLSGPFWGL